MSDFPLASRVPELETKISARSRDYDRFKKLAEEISDDMLEDCFEEMLRIEKEAIDLLKVELERERKRDAGSPASVSPSPQNNMG